MLVSSCCRWASALVKSSAEVYGEQQGDNEREHSFSFLRVTVVAFPAGNIPKVRPRCRTAADSFRHSGQVKSPYLDDSIVPGKN